MSGERALIEAPDATAAEALRYAYRYVDEDTEYVYGGQDGLRTIRIDCSGLVVNCYGYAVSGTPYALPFDDAAVIDFFRTWTRGTTSPRPGDLAFMGDDPAAPSHIALFVKEAEGRIYFIDSTEKPEEGIDGVTERSYASDDARFLSFGRLLLLE
jgi:cell wall-associated NlpC family hydrolase